MKKDHKYKNQKNQLMGELATGIIHSINNPLTAISMMSDKIQFLLDEYKEFEGEDDLDIEGVQNANHIISKTIVELKPLLNSINEFSIKESDECFNKSQIISIINKVKYMTEHLVNKNRIKVSYIDNTEDNIFKVKGNTNNIAQAMINCVKNSVEALVSGDVEEKWIEIAFSNDESDLSISVKDSGSLDLSLSEKVFDASYSTKEGRGVGLTFAKELVEMSMGELILVNDKHTNFQIKLPIFN